MRELRQAVVALLLLSSVAVAATAATVGSALTQFDQSVRHYNLISFGSASFQQYGDTEGGLAIGGNLYLDGGTIAAQPGKFALTSDPTLYVAGRLTVNDTAKLQSGYAAISAAANAGWSWDGQQNRLSAGQTVLSTVNTPDLRGDTDPRLNTGPDNWNFSSLRSDLIGVSQTLGAASANGLIVIDSQNLRFKAANANTHGAIVFDLDANLLVGNTYAGQMFSNVQFDVPEGDAFVVNVRNAAGRTLFGAGNFNSGTGYDRLLWNIVDRTPSTDETVRFGNGGQFYGAVLAPTWNVANDFGTAINGQVVADSFTDRGAELHFTGFNFHEEFDSEVPEPGTYGLVGAAACVGIVLVHRRRRRGPAVLG